MKRSEYWKLVKQTKLSLDEEQMWGEAEILLEKARQKRQDLFVQKPAEPVDPAKAPATAAPAAPRAAAPAPVPASVPAPAPAAVPVASVPVAPAPGQRDGFASAVTLEELKAMIGDCKKCPLGETRINLVFGVGNPKAQLMFIGEGPGFDEDRKGEPFVGKAGQLLTKIIEAMNLKREDVYIANVVKCHPMIDATDNEKRGNDRPPSPEEAAACLPFLERQIEIIKPKIICTLGNSAAQALLAKGIGITKLRGKFYEYKGIKLMPTYHPAALLRNPALKRDVWEDMKLIMAELQK